MGSDVASEGRRRIVMLVDNGVNGDSRVQKEARSAAEAGWDVTLLGRSPDRQEQTWTLGPAKVRLLPMTVPLNKRPHAVPPALAASRRWPIRPPASAEHRPRRSGRGRPTCRSSGRLKPEGAAGGSRSRRTWQWLPRARPLGDDPAGAARPAHGRRASGSTHPCDQAYTWFWRTVMGDRVLAPARAGAVGLGAGLRAGHRRARARPDPRQRLPDDRRGRPRQDPGQGPGGRDVKLVWDAHEFLPGIRPWTDHAALAARATSRTSGSTCRTRTPWSPSPTIWPTCCRSRTGWPSRRWSC